MTTNTNPSTTTTTTATALLLQLQQEYHQQEATTTTTKPTTTTTTTMMMNHHHYHRSLEINDAYILDDLSEQQARLLNLIPRLGSILSLVCAIWLIYHIAYMRNPNNNNNNNNNPRPRRGIFHRIMMGCGMNIVILQLTTLWGQWAVPIEFRNDGFPMARGTTATCSIQGFLYTMGFVVPSYYVALSILCYLAIRHKFHVRNYRWIEKYIHVGVYIFPLLSGCYLLSQQAYNPGIIDCYFVPLPIGCGNGDDDDTIVECERGPSNYAELARWLIGLPLGIILLFPTLIMVILYVKMRFLKGTKGRTVAGSLGRQAGIYLLALHGSYILRFVYLIVNLKFGIYSFILHVLSNTIEAMQGVWIVLAYCYLRSSSSSSSPSSSSPGQRGGNGGGAGRDDQDEVDLMEDFSTTMDCNSTNGGGAAGNGVHKKEIIGSSSTRKNNGQVESGGKKISSRVSRAGCEEDARGINKKMDNDNPVGGDMIRSFSIFDGTGVPDPNSPWAQYLMDDSGEDEDYQNNCGEYDDSDIVLHTTNSATINVLGQVVKEQAVIIPPTVMKEEDEESSYEE